MDSYPQTVKNAYKRFGILSLSYAVVMGGFGLLGYLSKGSHISLISGGTSGLILLFLATRLMQEKKWALYAFTTTNAVLCAMFFMRFLKTKAIYPPLILFFVSTGFLVIAMKMVQAATQDKPSSN